MRFTTQTRGPVLGLLLATSALGLTACGASYSEDDIAVAALSSRISAELPTEQAHCTAEKMVETIGADELTKAGALTKDHVAELKGQFSKTVATQIADATVACWDWRKNTELWAAAYPTAEPKDWNRYVRCAKKLDGKLHASIVAVNQKGASLAPRDAFTKAQQKCQRALGQPVR